MKPIMESVDLAVGHQMWLAVAEDLVRHSIIFSESQITKTTSFCQ
jgi:hypothetical protein